MTDIVIALAVVFVTAGALLLVANQLELPIVPFYIIAGLLTGLVVGQPALVDLALWGIAFLVFVFGIRVDIGDLQAVLRDGEVAAFAQLIVVAPVAIVVGYALGDLYGFQDPFRNALYFGAAATLSSTLVGSQILEREIREGMLYGRLASSIHFFDDVVALGAVLILSADVLADSQLVTSKIGYGVLFVLAGLLIYRHGYPALVRVADGGEELILMGSISILIAFIAAAEAVGISIVVAAFAAGLAVRSEGVESLGVRNGIESIKDFFAAIFFVTLGALVSVPTPEVLVLATVLTLLVVAVNPAVHAAAFVLEGYDGRTAFLTASNLNQVSELSLVIAIQGWLLGTIATPLFDAIVLAGAATMLLSSVAGRYEQLFYEIVLSRFLEGQTRHIDTNSSIDEGIAEHVVVIGYGRQGRRIVETLEELEVPYVVVENDPTVRGNLRENCRNYVFGDAMASYPMELARIRHAGLVVSTVDHRPVSESLLEHDTDADVILRADQSTVASELLDAGADFVAVPDILASDQLVENVERVLGDERMVATLEADHREFLDLMEVLETERRYG
ncbi:Kef-type K+ transport system, membrane component [Halalkaliarchaeum desulfuricum]|uniref:Kef-type K+ transport system, membrane component n=1 Tax=Halalkaliarchaeum desulfuricum TaxID=2055893 RepID=A0A343TGE3_9EURY|nr:cation:proton antiporter [Halalkaliarchaeum desulfuricum]AUX08165.1 Kef-type K+ transport system, membrane component [Halalkaliarchaeum desulfuricum]